MNDPLVITGGYVKDTDFDRLYPEHIRRLSKQHWSPVEIAIKAASFLAAEPGTNVLDIGSGVGKFCLAAGCYFGNNHFVGVEQRGSLVKTAREAQHTLGIENVSFIHGNFTQLDFAQFDHFYFYNAFYENLMDELQRIDDDIVCSEGLYNYYTGYLYKLLEAKPVGTRLVTYHSLFDEIPYGYVSVENDASGLFNCWIKTA